MCEVERGGGRHAPRGGGACDVLLVPAELILRDQIGRLSSFSLVALASAQTLRVRFESCQPL